MKGEKRLGYNISAYIFTEQLGVTEPPPWSACIGRSKRALAVNIYKKKKQENEEKKKYQART